MLAIAFVLAALFGVIAFIAYLLGRSRVPEGPAILVADPGLAEAAEDPTLTAPAAPPAAPGGSAKRIDSRIATASSASSNEGLTPGPQPGASVFAPPAPADQLGSATQLDPEEVPRAPEDGTGAGHPQSSAALFASIQELQHRFHGEEETARQKIGQLGQQTLQSVLQELETASSSVVEQTRRRMQEEARAALSSFSEEASRRTDALTEDYVSTSVQLQARRAQATEDQIDRLVKAAVSEVVPSLEERLKQSSQKSAEELVSRVSQPAHEQAQTVRRTAAEAIDSITSAGERAVVLCQMVQQRIKDALRSVTEGHSKRVEEDASAFSEALQRESDTRLRSFQDQLEGTLRSFLERAATETQGQLQKLADHMLKLSADQLQTQVDKTAQTLGEKLRVSSRALVDETSSQLAQQSRVAAEQCRSELNEIAQARARELQAENRPFWESRHPARRDLVEEEFGRLGRESTRPHPQPIAGGLLLKVGLLCCAGIIPVALFVFLSVRPVTRLRMEPPAEFVDSRTGWTAKRRATEERFARDYWKCAWQQLQWTYPFGTRLPDEPPVEFKIEDDTLPGQRLGADISTRARYWRRLQQLWPRPEVWEESHEWNTDWIRGVWTSLRAKLG